MALVLGGVFGTASATVESVDDVVVVVDLSVEVRTSAEAVVAHLRFGTESDLTLPLIERGDGVFGLRTELEPKNYVVVFEILGDEGATSQPITLTELGAELGPESGTATTAPEEDESLSRESRQLLWLAVALGAGSLSVLAFWVLDGPRVGKEPLDVTEEE